MSILPLMLMSTATSSYVASRLSQDKAEEVLERKYYIIYGLAESGKKQYWDGLWWINEREKAKTYNSFEKVLSNIKKFSSENTNWSIRNIDWEVY